MIKKLWDRKEYQLEDARIRFLVDQNTFKAGTIVHVTCLIEDLQKIVVYDIPRAYDYDYGELERKNAKGQIVYFFDEGIEWEVVND